MTEAGPEPFGAMLIKVSGAFDWSTVSFTTTSNISGKLQPEMKSGIAAEGVGADVGVGVGVDVGVGVGDGDGDGEEPANGAGIHANGTDAADA